VWLSSARPTPRVHKEGGLLPDDRVGGTFKRQTRTIKWRGVRTISQRGNGQHHHQSPTDDGSCNDSILRARAL